MTIRTSIETDRTPGLRFGQQSQRVRMAASVLAGTALAGVGISRRNWVGAALAIGGGYLAYRGIEDNIQPAIGSARISFTINKPPHEVFAFARDPQNWQKLVPGCEIQSTSEKSFRLRYGKDRALIESEIWITDEEKDDFVAWSSVPGKVEHRGVLHVRPAPGDRGTELLVAMEFYLPASPLMRAITSAAGLAPAQILRESLRRMKNLLEAGEIPTTVGQPLGFRGLKAAALQIFLHKKPTGTIPQQTQIASD